MIASKQIEVFCGTGGVGKTTLATSRALNLASQNKKVLLITIDPAKRLKQVLKIEDDASGSVHSVSSTVFLPEQQEFHFDACLLSPAATFQKIAEVAQESVDLNNTILKILTKPYGGLNEIMAIVEVQRQLKTGLYDTIVLDTPPGKHFIDFLESSHKIQNFFDSSFIEIFKYLGKSFEKEAPSRNFIKTLISSGIKKLLSYLEKVTGKEFVELFVDAIVNIYRNKEGFLNALTFGEELKNPNFSNWFLVASVDQMKVNEVRELKTHAKQYLHEDTYLILNRCIEPLIQDWIPNDDKLQLFKKTLITKEQRLKDFSNEQASQLLEFTEILLAGPEQHVATLSNQWPK